MNLTTVDWETQSSHTVVWSTPSVEPPGYGASRITICGLDDVASVTVIWCGKESPALPSPVRATPLSYPTEASDAPRVGEGKVLKHSINVSIKPAGSSSTDSYRHAAAANLSIIIGRDRLIDPRQRAQAERQMTVQTSLLVFLLDKDATQGTTEDTTSRRMTHHSVALYLRFAAGIPRLLSVAVSTATLHHSGVADGLYRYSRR